MSAYDIQQHEQSARLLRPEPGLREPGLFEIRGETSAVASRRINPAGIDEGSLMDALIDRLADRVADAVIDRLGPKRNEDEWLDSRQAAEYLGVHRDTLRRLAAARAIPSEQDGRGCRLFFRRSALDQWRQSGGRSRHLAAPTDAA